MRNPRPGAQENEDPADLIEQYQAVRNFTEALVDPLSPEDCTVQTMPDVSPTRWHLAHTTWFFETFVLARAVPRYEPFHPKFAYLFNSYYNTVGAQFPRPRRGVLSRPSQSEVLDYRAHVDDQMSGLLAEGPSKLDPQIGKIVELGLHHEQQHQELILTDIKHVLSCNPMHPAYRSVPVSEQWTPAPLRWASYDEGIRWLGSDGEEFWFDNESPRHRVFLESFEFGTRVITNAEYLEFMHDGGYRNPALWLSEGWQEVTSQGWRAPLYWVDEDGVGDGSWQAFSLGGLAPINPAAPVCHVSYFEADAYARWAGARLPKEAEWEVAAGGVPPSGNLVESGTLSPEPAADTSQPVQMFGDVWEWTSSSYAPYPRYEPTAGALGEYNGKFMCNQYVLRGGSCVTSESHIRPTYRNFFPANTRWQFTGIRLAK